jgi:DNA-binding NarL/FixJ family response regulator
MEAMSFTDPTTILLIDAHNSDRTYYAKELKISSPDCIVLQAKNGRSGLDLYKSRRVDCLVAELDLPDMSIFQLLVDVVPPQNRREVAVVILTRAVVPAVADLARCHGAQAVLIKRLTSGEELAQAVRKSMAMRA